MFICLLRYLTGLEPGVTLGVGYKNRTYTPKRIYTRNKRAAETAKTETKNSDTMHEYINGIDVKIGLPNTVLRDLSCLGYFILGVVFAAHRSENSVFQLPKSGAS